jgi:two-component system cell cycle response regulator CpdR
MCAQGPQAGKDITPMADILLAIEDDAMRGYLARLLLRQGHTVSPVCNGRDALTHLVPGAIEILIAQDRMAKIDGPELARRAAAAVPGLRVLFLKGFSVHPLKESARPVLDEEVLEAPFHLNRLAIEIDNLLAA